MTSVTKRISALISGMALLVAPLALAPAVEAAPEYGAVVIKEVYGGGGNSGAQYTHDFVELFNPTGSDINLAGYQLHYYSAKATTPAHTVTLTGVIKSKRHYLIQLAQGAGGSKALPAADFQAAANLSGTQGAVELTDGAKVIDLVGWGAAAKFEGSGPGPATSNTTSVSRDGLAEDTDNNAVDLALNNIPTPQNSQATSIEVAPKGPTIEDHCGTVDDAFYIPREAGIRYTTGRRQELPPGKHPHTRYQGIWAAPAPGFHFTEGVETSWKLSFTDESCDSQPVTPIKDIQGTGFVSPLDGKLVTTRGVITALYPEGNILGAFIQTPGTPDLADGKSDGIFVNPRAGTFLQDVKIGDYIELRGLVGDSLGTTSIGGELRWKKLEESFEPVVAVEIEWPKSDAELEALEGMLVKPKGTYTVTNNYRTNENGELELAYGTERLFQPGELANPVTQPAEFAAVAEKNAKLRVTLADGQRLRYWGDQLRYSDIPLPYLDVSGRARVGAHLTFTQPVVVAEDNKKHKLHPTRPLRDGSTGPVSFGPNTRTAPPGSLGGNVTLGSFNVLNYFTALGQDEPGCKWNKDRKYTPITTDRCKARGAYRPESLARQEEKIVSALNALDASIVGLEEIETSSQFGKDRDEALAALVAALNASNPGKWDYVRSPAAVPNAAGEDVIRTAFIYQPAQVTPQEESVILEGKAFGNARLPLAQKWQAGPKGATFGPVFVTVVNHFKSKSSGEDDGTGQGLANPDRKRQSTELAEWVKEKFAAMPVFLLGDFNAYSAEDPIRILEAAGFTDLGLKFNTTKTYVFSGGSGTLDHILANQAALELVRGAAVWNINSVEPIALEYSRYNRNVVNYHKADPFRSSDHDPMKVGIQIAAPAPAGLSGRVEFVSEGSALITPVLLRVYDGGGTEVARQFVAAGSAYSFELPDGSYTIKATAYRPYRVDGASSRAVTVKDGKAAANWRIALR